MSSSPSLPSLFVLFVLRSSQGLRANTSKPQSQLDKFLQEAIEEIRKELRGGDMDLKAGAVLKMVYVSIELVSLLPFVEP